MLILQELTWPTHRLHPPSLLPLRLNLAAVVIQFAYHSTWCFFAFMVWCLDEGGRVEAHILMHATEVLALTLLRLLPRRLDDGHL